MSQSIDNFNSILELDGKTDLYMDTECFSYFERANNIRLAVSNRLFHENTGYNTIMKMMVCIEIKDMPSKYKSSVYLTWSNLFEHQRSLQGVFKKHIVYNQPQSWFAMINGTPMLNQQMLDSSGGIKELCYNLDEDKFILLKPWKSAISPDPQIIMTVRNKEKDVNICMPINVFRNYVQKLKFLSEQFDTVRIGLCNQLIMKHIYRNLGSSNVNSNISGIEQYEQPLTEQQPVNISPPPQDYSDDYVSDVMPEETKVEPVTTVDKPKVDNPIEMDSAPSIDVGNDDEDSNDNLPESSPTPTEPIETDDPPLPESTPSVVEEDDEEPDAPPSEEVSELDALVNDVLNADKHMVALIPDTIYKSIFVDKFNGQLDTMISVYMNLHLESFTLKDELYFNESDIPKDVVTGIKSELDSALTPLSKDDVVEYHITRTAFHTIPAKFEGKTELSKNQLYNVVELLMYSNYIRLIRNMIVKSKDESGYSNPKIQNQFYYRTYTTLNYESIFNYLVPLHHKVILESIDSGLFEEIYGHIRKSIELNKDYLYKNFDKVISEYGDIKINHDEVFNSDQFTLHVLKENIKNCLIEKEVLEEGKPETKTEVKSEPLEVHEDVPFSALSKLFAGMKNNDKFGSTENKELVVEVLSQCPYTIVEAIDHDKIEKFTETVANMDLIYKWAILNWKPIYKKELHTEAGLKKLITIENQAQSSRTDLKDYDMTITLKISSLFKARELIYENKEQLKELLKDYDYTENIQNLYDETKKELNEITGDPYLTTVIIEYFHIKTILEQKGGVPW